MPKIVYNSRYGGFSLSDAGVALYEKLSGKELEGCSGRDIPRHCPHLVRVVEELGPRANGFIADLELTDEVPEGQRYRISEYDGAEEVQFPDTIDWLRAKTTIRAMKGTSHE